MGQAIRKARKLRNKTQEETAAALGVSRPSMTQWERDITHPSVPNLKKLCDFLQVDAEALMAGVVNPHDVHNAHQTEREDINQTLGLVCAVLEREIGFSPSQDQALRWLIKKAGVYDAVFS